MSSRKRKGFSKSDIGLEFAVGLFFFSALVVLGVFTVLLGREAFWFEGQRLDVRFPSVAGLKKGDNVLVRGVDVGNVESIELLDPGAPDESDRGIMVTLELDQRIPLHNDYTIEVRHSSVLGGRHVVIEPGMPDTGRSATDHLTGSAPPDLVNEAAQMVQTLHGELQRVKDALRQGELIPKASELITNLHKITTELSEGRGTAGKILADEELYNQLLATLASAEDAATSMERLASDTRDVVRKVRDGKGTLARLIEDESLYTDIQSVVGDAEELISAAAQQESTFSRFLNDDGRLYDNVLSATQDMKNVMAELRKGDGTLARLLNDPELYEQSLQAIQAVKDAVDDFREQAPVSTFGNLIFGAL